MRISGWRVDGYGVLCDHRVTGLPPGVSVLLGPNEAGKSTQLDFVRSVLFGFPDRRHSQPQHLPLSGGRHGGALELLDEDGRPWLLERHGGSRAASLTAPDGAAGTDEDLRRLLGGADVELFRTVFAFGLGELATLHLLDRDEVRDLVFSAGILGAGRSASRAAKVLAERQAALVRPRQGAATANKLHARLAELDDELRVARAEAERYPEHVRALERVVSAGSAARSDASLLRRRAAEVAALERSWPVLVARNDALEQRRALPPLDAGATDLLAREPALRLLAQQGSGHAARVEQRAGLERERAEVDDALRRLVDELGRSATLRSVLDAAYGPDERSRLASLIRRSAELAAKSDAAAGHVEAGEAERRARERRLGAGAKTAEPRSVAQLEEALRSLAELRQLVAERDRLAATTSANEHAERLARLAAGAPVRSLPAFVPALLALAVAGTAVYAHRSDGAVPTAVLAATAAVLAVLAVLAARSSRHGRAGGAPGDGRGVPAAGTVDLDRIVARVADGARAAGLPAAPSSVEVEAAARRVEDALAGKRHTEQLAHDVEEANAKLDEARRQLADLVDGQAELAEEVVVLGTAFGVDCKGDAHALADAVTAVEEIRALARRRASITADVARLDGAIGQFATEVAEVARGLGGIVGRARVGESPTAAPDVLEILEIAGRRLDDLLAMEDRRRSLETTATERDAEIDRSLGSGADGKRLRAELESGDVVAWSAERVELEERIERADATREELLRARHAAERDMAQLERSACVAELEASRGACAAELGTALEQYAVLTLARSLLSRTLAVYERERQPAVVASASTLFAAVTEGRYVRLVARVDSETGRSQGIEAISASGARVDAGDLSRGTAEQLYLCVRLALADSFAARAAVLPFVLDDVLVNFDPTRARAVARVVADIGRRHQVLAFTCHPHVAEMLTSAAPDARLVELDRPR